VTKKNFILSMSAGCLFLAAFSPTAVAADGPYLAADFGQSHFTGDDLELAAQPGWARSESDGSAYRLTAGYQFTPYLGLEVGYVDLGHGTVTYRSTPAAAPSVITMVSTQAGVRGGFAAVTGTWPIDPQWSLYARGGGISGKLDVDTQQSNGAAGDNTFTAWTATYGVGVKWNFQPQWSLRLGYDHYHNLGNRAVEASLLSLGVEWRFSK
jgi:OOP family OmpA-OmpF porin